MLYSFRYMLQLAKLLGTFHNIKSLSLIHEEKWGRQKSHPVKDDGLRQSIRYPSNKKQENKCFGAKGNKIY